MTSAWDIYEAVSAAHTMRRYAVALGIPHDRATSEWERAKREAREQRDPELMRSAMSALLQEAYAS